MVRTGCFHLLMVVLWLWFTGMLFSTSLLVVTPYKRHDDNMLATASSIVLSCTFFCSLLIKVIQSKHGTSAHAAPPMLLRSYVRVPCKGLL